MFNDSREYWMLYSVAITSRNWANMRMKRRVPLGRSTKKK